MPGKFLQPDHSRGDANTIGGYMSVHARPAAFEGSDGMSYSVAIEIDETGEAERPFAAYFLFLRWRRVGAQGVEGHLETDYLAFGATADAARDSLGAWRLDQVKDALEALIRDSTPDGDRQRRWWDVMREDE
jgi:hypothetical protein